MPRCRRVAVVGAAVVGALGPTSGAGATHTGGEHARTEQAHAKVRHHDYHGTHTAHASIPYCPPDDAPRD